MADQNEIDATIGRLHDAGATDEEITSLIKEKYGKPFDVNAQNATMRANMHAQDAAATRPPESEWTGAKMLDRGLSGLQGEAEGALAGVVAPVAALGTAIAHPVDTVKNVGKGVFMLGAAGIDAAKHPAETYDAAKNAAIRIGANPEAIGGIAGGTMAAIALPGVTKALARTRIGKAVVAGVSDAANRIPGVEAAREAYAGPKAALALGAKGPTAAELATQRAAERDALGVVPTADAVASRPTAAYTPARQAVAPAGPGQSEADYIRSQVVSNADAVASRPDAVRPDTSAYGYTPGQSEDEASTLRKAFEDRMANAPRLSKQPGAQPLENELASTLREPLATLTDDEAVASEAPGRGDMTRTGRPATTPQDFAADQAKLDTGTATRSQGALDPETTAMEKVVKGEPLTDDEKLIIAKRLTSQANSAPKTAGNATQPRHPETGQFVKADEAAKKGVEATMTPEERALIGNRGAGAATIDKRKQMLDELIARARAEGK